MRITSRLLSFRLCAFSVLSARMRYASVSSGETSAVICRRPSTFAAARRWRPFGVHSAPSAPRTTINGSRNAPASSIFAPAASCASARGRAGTASAAPRRAAATRAERPTAERIAIGADRRAAGRDDLRGEFGDLGLIERQRHFGRREPAPFTRRRKFAARAPLRLRFGGGFAFRCHAESVAPTPSAPPSGRDAADFSRISGHRAPHRIRIRAMSPGA